jgi:hypothetical protein
MEIAPKLPPLSNEEWEALLDELASGVSLNVPLLSDYAVSREGIYEDDIDRIMGYTAENPEQV